MAARHFDWEDAQVDGDAVPDCWADVGSSDTDDDEVTKADAEIRFLDAILEVHLSGCKLTSKYLCIIAHWYKLSGHTGPLSKFAVKPDSTNFNRMVKKCLSMNKDQKKLMQISVPTYSKASMGRVERLISVKNPHEVLHNEVVGDPSLAAKLDAAIVAETLAPVYFEHPLVVEAQSRGIQAHGYDMYLDGVPTTKRDGVIGIWVSLLVSVKRHLCVAIQKSRLCRCGCRGWCTLWPILNLLGWSVEALADSLFPNGRPDKLPWLDSDSERMIWAATQLALLGVCIYVKGDWAEFAYTMALASWATAGYPCFECFALRSEWMRDLELDAMSYPFQLVTQDDYDAACGACEHYVTVVSQEMHHALSRILMYDNRDDTRGAHGRALTVDFPALGLLRGDRLEPFELLQDVGLGFDMLDEFPVQVLFWRPSSETRAKHRNPFFRRRAHVGLATLLEEWLHCFHLGILKDFNTQLVWELLLSDAFRVPYRGDRAPSAHEYLEDGCELLRAGLLTWYKKQEPGDYTEYQEFSYKMIGTANKRCLKAKGAELKGLLFYFVSLLSCDGYVRDRIANGDVWLASARALKSMLDQMKQAPMRVSVELQQTLINIWLSYRRYAARLLLDFFPKTHLIGHALHRYNKKIYKKNL